MRQSKMKHELVLKHETTRSESSQTVTREEQRISTNSVIANDTT